MSDNNKNDPNEFEDDAFDVEEEFTDADFEETAYDEADFSEDVDGDLEYTDEDFADEEWQEDESAPMAAGPGGKKLYRGGSDKKPLMSFNTMVIIGALVVGGGVLVFTVMNKTQEANQAKSSIFRSMLNISDVMDGKLFGDKTPEPPAVETPAVDTATSVDGGFLNNPDQLATTETTPPQPSPIAPADSTAAPNEPLTPMPEDTAQVPRAPDASVPPAEAIPAEPVPPEPVVAEEGNKAEELLKEAMANRDKTQEEAPAVPAETIPVAETPAPGIPAPVPAEPAAQPAPEPTPPAPVADVQTAEAVKALESKLDAVLSRMNAIESEVSSLKQSGGTNADLKAIEDSVQDLKQDLNEIKARPATVVEKTVVEKVERDEPAEAPKPAVKKKAPAPKKAVSTEAPAKVPAASGSWELRAAQPGKAWVSRPGERDMRGVQVGETLPGIGQITGIIYQNGRWTVQGTQGQILQ